MTVLGYLGDPKSNHQCPSKKEAEGAVKEEAVTYHKGLGTRQPQAKLHLQPQEAGGCKGQILSWNWKECGPAIP